MWTLIFLSIIDLSIIFKNYFFILEDNEQKIETLLNELNTYRQNNEIIENSSKGETENIKSELKKVK